jgi:tetratricopeptide (TPR) repeat protein
MALMDDGDYARAEIDLKRELAADPQNPDALFDLAYCQYRLQQYEKAVQTLRDRMTVKKGMAREWSLLADAYLGMGLCYQGLDAANYALKIGDDDRELARHLAFQRGFLNYRVGDDRQSEADWRQAARLTPDASERAGALENVGLVLTRAGRWQEALANCDAVDRLSPDMAWNALFRAIAADKLGQVPMARLAYARWRASRGPDDQDDLGRLLPDALRGYLTAPPEAWRQATSAAGIDAAPTSSKSNARKPGADARKPVSGARASGARKKANR